MAVTGEGTHNRYHLLTVFYHIKIFLLSLVKKNDVFSPEKNGDTRSKLRLFRAECGQLGRAGQLGHIQW